MQLTSALDALYRNDNLQVQTTIEATEVALAGLSVGISLWRGEEQVAAGRQSLGIPAVDERGHYAEWVGFSLAVTTLAHWSAEIPNCYRAVITLWRGDELLKAEAWDIGFRRIEITDGLPRLSGRPLLIHGVNRHEHYHLRGQAVTEADMVQGILLMKRNNLNVVCCPHYPSASRWYELCSRYDLYVVDEVNIETHGTVLMNRLSDDPTWLPAFNARVIRTVQNSRNHPCIIIRSLGNESGNDDNQGTLYHRLKCSDPSRPVQYEGGGVDITVTDIIYPMYARVECDQPTPAIPK